LPFILSLSIAGLLMHIVPARKGRDLLSTQSPFQQNH
jgi:hypothetical protein